MPYITIINGCITDTMDDIEIEKSNMLMVGPTGCGKTYLVKTISEDC